MSVDFKKISIAVEIFRHELQGSGVHVVESDGASVFPQPDGKGGYLPTSIVVLAPDE